MEINLFFSENMAALPQPVNISPLIKFGRWTALSTGVLWGLYRLRKNRKTEAEFQAYEAIQRPIRQAKFAEEKKRLVKEELLYLAKESGVPVPPDFNEKY